MNQNLDWNQKISMHDYVRIKDDIFFFALNFNGLYRMKLSEKRLELLGCVPGEATYQKHIYGAITENRGKLYLPPRNGKEIAVFDIHKRSFEKISLRYDAQGVPFKFSGAVSDGKKVFLIPARYRYLVVIDTDMQVVEYVDDWVEKLIFPSGYDGLFIGRGYFVKQGSLYMATMTDNTLIKLPLDTMKAEMIPVGDGKSGFSDMCMDQDDESIWLVQKRNPAILKWTEQSGECIVYDKMPIGFIHGEVPFVSVIETESKVTAIGYHANMSVEVDKANGTIRRAEWDAAGTEGAFNVFKAMHYFAKKISSESFVVSNIDDNSFDVIQNGNVKEKIYLTDRCSDVALAHFNDGIIQERGNYSLQRFIDFIESRS